MKHSDYIQWQHFTKYQKESENEALPENIELEVIDFYYHYLFTVEPFSIKTNMLQWNYEHYTGKKSDFLLFVQWSIKAMGEFNFKDKDEIMKSPDTSIVKKQVKEWIKQKKQENAVGGMPTVFQKIKWNGSPSVFGYLFLEFVKHGFIEPPLRNGESNYAGFAKLCYHNFDIKTTLENLIKEMNPGKNQLSNTKQAKFTIPDLSDLA